MKDTVSSYDPANLEKLASLLATEDLIVEHAAVPTASFDLKNRKVVLPTWKEMSKSLYHMLVLHEIGHALYTPFEEFKGHVDDNDKNLKDYINVIEDARIERKIKIMYPGSRKDFNEGYNTLNERDFFGCLERDPSSLNLIDRINLHFKLGSRVHIEFAPEEQIFVDEAERTVTFQDVVPLAKKIYEYAQEQAETAQEHQNNPDDPDEWDDWDITNPDPQEGEEEEEDSEEGNDGEGDQVETPEDSEGSEGSQAMTEEHEGGHGISAQTVSEFERNMTERMVMDNARAPEYYDIDLRNLDYKKIVIDFKSVIKEFQYATESRLPEDDNDAIWKWFLQKNKNSVNYLVKEFEMKKAAEQYSRAKTDKTGKVDPNKLFNYKFSDDIFLRNTVMPGAKSHGLVLFLDLSGSMTENMLGTVSQLLCLTMFCRKAGIPHRVYGFTDCWFNRERIIPAAGDTLLSLETHGFKGARGDKARLLEFFTEKMKNQDFMFMAKNLLEIGFAHNYRYSWSRKSYPEGLDDAVVPTNYSLPLGGTPLNECLAYARNLIEDFRKETNSEIANFVCLTDGGSNSLDARWGIARDKETRMQSDFNRHHNQTEFLLKILKKTCGVHAINFYISPDRRPWSISYENLNVQERFRKEKMVTTHNWLGFDDVHTIMGGKALNHKEVSIDDAKKIQKGALARTMIKMGGNRRGSRVILSKFIDRIAA